MDSDYSVRLATLEAMGGDMTKHYDSVYDIDLAILTLTEQGGGGLAPDAGFNYATKYIDDDTGIEHQNIATGSYSNWAEGSKTKATSANGGNHAEGYETEAIGDLGCHSEGGWTKASGYAAHAEGCVTEATGTASHAEGMGSFYGTKNTASGEASHAEGSMTTASGSHSHAEGHYTRTQNQAEHAEGANNLSHKNSNSFGDSGNTIHSVGIGTVGSQTLKNAVEVMQNGDMYLYGVGGYVGTDTKVQNNTIKTLQEYIASLESRISALEGN